MDNLLLGVVFGIAIFYIFNRVDKLKNLFKSRITHTCQLEFKLSKTLLSNPKVLSLAGITKAQYKEDFDKWPRDRKKKWNDFLESKNTNLGWEDLYFSFTYLSQDDVFIIEAFHNSNRYSYVSINRSPNNTYLFDKTLIYYPNKDTNLRDEHIRLEIKLRQDNGYYLISVGLREFKKQPLEGSNYTRLFDFPFAKGGSSELRNEEYQKFDFKVERLTPWYDKDDFGNYVAHPWDTQVTYKHKSGAEITHQY